MADDRLEALRPRWRGQSGFYEVWYLKANLVEAQASAWLRYTLTALDAGQAVAELWAIVDQAGSVTPRKASWPIDRLTMIGEPFGVEVPGGRLDADGARGWVDPIGWELAWQATGEPFWHLPRWAYRLPAPKSKVATPCPDLHVSGTIQVDQEQLVLEAAPGQLGHVWGDKHADTWAWAHGNRVDGLAWEAITAQPPVGPWTSPPVTVVLVRHEGQTIAFRNVLRNRGAFELDRYRFDASTRGFRVAGEITSDHRVAVRYTDPDGEASHCHNTKRATSELRLWEDGALVGSWRDDGATAFEVGSREADPGTEVVL